MTFQLYTDVLQDALNEQEYAVLIQHVKYVSRYKISAYNGDEGVNAAQGLGCITRNVTISPPRVSRSQSARVQREVRPTKCWIYIQFKVGRTRQPPRVALTHNQKQNKNVRINSPYCLVRDTRQWQRHSTIWLLDPGLREVSSSPNSPLTIQQQHATNHFLLFGMNVQVELCSTCQLKSYNFCMYVPL